MKTEAHSTASLFDWAVVREALRRAMSAGEGPSGRANPSLEKHEIEISVLINDVFGGKILKTHTGGGWHFYNRINGEYIDLAGKEGSGSSDSSGSGITSGTTVQTTDYCEHNCYTKFFMRFVTAFEEAVGLGKIQPA